MFKIKTFNNIAAVGLQRFPAERFQVADEIDQPDAIILRSHSLHDMEIADSLVAIGRAGAGVNNIPVEAMSARGIPVFNAPGANANAVKELAVAGMLLAARNLCDARDYVLGLTDEGDALALTFAFPVHDPKRDQREDRYARAQRKQRRHSTSAWAV